MHLKGTDISPEAIKLAQEELQLWKKAKAVTNVSFNLQTETQTELAEKSVDLVLSTLVCHHLTDEDLVGFSPGFSHSFRRNP